MNRSNLTGLVLILALGIPALGAPAPDAGDELLQKLYLKLCNILINHKDSPKNVMFSFANPGIGINDTINLANATDAREIFNLTDMQFIPGPVMVKSKSSISDQYHFILENKVNVKTELTAKEAADRDKLLAILDPEGPDMQKYYQYQTKYEDAALEVATQQLADLRAAKKVSDTGENEDSEVSPIAKLKTAATNAWNEWNTTGRKSAIKAAQNSIRQYDNKDQSAWWASLSDKFESAKGPFEGTRTVIFNPNPKNWKDKNGWVKFFFTSSELENKTDYTSRDISASATLNVGKFSGSASGSNSLKTSNISTKTKSSTLEFSLKRVFITRPWLNTAVFSNRGWKFNTDNANVIVSGGNTYEAALKAPKAILPMITDSLILIKDLKIRGAMAEDIQATRNASTEAKAKVSYGPFFTGEASYKSTSDSSSHHNKTSEASIESPGMQVIGVISTFVEKCPDPDPKIKWDK